MTISEAEAAVWREAVDIVDALLELPAATRTESLATMRIDESVRERVLELLTADERRGVLDEEAGLVVSDEAQDLLGRRLGHWRLIEEVGRGGMAVVYRAERVESDFEQTAAIKLLPRGSAGLAHFQREQRVLSSLAHPNISRFLDGGIDADGTPWLAMEYVDGDRIDADLRGVPVRERVKRLLPIVDAVGYAHRVLVIHRDLKPGNILIDHDGRARLLDFGIAKLLSDDSASDPTRIMTPRFAAPEQMAGEAVSTATDVYGIGAVLHALLTGEPPRDAQGNPSSAIEGAPIDADLRNIVRKALREEPPMRYGTAQALSADLTAWLEGLPVEATPGTNRYRLRKWLARHWLGAVTSAAVVVLAIASAAAIAWQMRERALQEETVAAQYGLFMELVQSPSAVARGRQARLVDVVAELPAKLTARLETPSLERAQLHAALANTLRELGDPEAGVAIWQQALDDLASVGDDVDTRISYMTGLGQTLADAGRSAEARQQLLAARDLALAHLRDDDARRAMIPLHLAVAWRETDLAQAIKWLSEADRIARAVSWTPVSERLKFECGRLSLQLQIGQFEEAVARGADFLALARSEVGERHGYTLCAYQGYSTALARSGESARAEDVARQGADTAAEWLGENDRRVFALKVVRANVTQEQGRGEEAVQLHRELYVNADDVPGLSLTDKLAQATSLVAAIMETGRYGDAEPILRATIERARSGLGATHFLTLINSSNLAELLIFDDRPDEALTPATAAVDGTTAELGGAHPLTLSTSVVKAGVLAHSGQPSEALTLLDQAVPLLAATYGESNLQVINAEVWQARALIDVGRAEEAGLLLKRALRIRLEVSGPDHPRTREVESILTMLEAGR